MTLIREEMPRKVTGDIRDEAPEAGFRLAATLLVRNVSAMISRELGDSKDDKAREFPGSKVGRVLLSEPVVGFALAAALEFVPGLTLESTRRRLAYNLRIRSWEGVAEKLPVIKKLVSPQGLRSQVGEALRSANVPSDSDSGAESAPPDGIGAKGTPWATLGIRETPVAAKKEDVPRKE